MGCCFSSTATTTSKTNQKNQNPPKPHNSPLKPPIIQSHKTPPPPPPPPPPEEEEEETVIKEVLVLSETPTLDKKQQEKNTQTPLTIPPKTQTEDSSPIKKQQQQQQHEQETSDLSQLSEIYSITETISTTPTTTTTTATKGLKEDEATSKENSEVKNKSPAKVIKKRPSNGDPGSVRARRVDPSPEKKAQCRGRGSRELRTVQRNVGSRSRSPGTGRAGGVGKGAFGKSPTTVTGKTDSKPVGAVTVEGQGKREEDGKGDVMEQQLGTESLENPLVSLECFIFL